jgi:transcriptional antiterminator RfaH
LPLKILRPTVYPENLLAEPPPQGSDGPSWFVFHTRPRAEKALAERLLALSLAYFLPLEKRQWRNSGRFFTSYLPLFPGYLFFQGDREQRGKALETNLVANVLPVTDQHRLHADLRNINRLLDSGKSLTPERRLPPGTPVVIRSGPLAGIEGIVVRDGKGTRVVVSVRILRQGVSVEVDGRNVEPLAVR